MLSLLLLAFAAAPAAAVDNGLARTPQMGWNNWNSLGCDVSQSLLLDTARVLKQSGLQHVGYQYVVLDDCWSDGRNADKSIRVDKEKFPNGMKWMADQLHRDGFLYGMYSSAGELTCARYAGSLDYEEYDAKSWASWDVDYLKYDNCYHRGRFGYPEVSFNRYNTMWQALNATGRPMLYSLCNWGEDSVHTWGMSIANSWRMSGDIYDSFNRPDDLCSCTDASSPLCIAPGSHCSVMNIINKVAPYTDRGGPGGWNDLDMLEVGGGGMSDDEYKVHFGMWAALKSPLLIGADLRELTPETLTILNNPAVIAVNQDPLGRAVHRISRNSAVAKDKYSLGETQIWSGPLYPDDQLVIFLNAAPEDQQMTVSLEEIFVSEGPGGTASQNRQPWAIHDLWANRMNLTDAAELLKTKDIEESFKELGWYNSTLVSYKDGLDAGDLRLLGKPIGRVEAGGSISATVRSHSLEMYRLRSLEGGSQRYKLRKDEL